MMDDITIFGTLGVSLLGIAVVFAMLVILMVIIVIFGKTMGKSASKPAADVKSAEAPAAVKAAAAPGSVGEIKLFDVPDKTAAMLMAIVADKVGAPLNELRFISIKQVD